MHLSSIIKSAEDISIFFVFPTSSTSSDLNFILENVAITSFSKKGAQANKLYDKIFEFG